MKTSQICQKNKPTDSRSSANLKEKAPQSTSIHIIIKLLTTKDKGKSLKSTQGKIMHTFTEMMFQMTVDVSSKILGPEK